MAANVTVGEYVQHNRFGPSKVVEVTADSVVVARRGAEDVRLSVNDVERALLPMPNDGFCALMWSRDLDSKFLRDHIEDVVLRLMRDRRRRSITIEEIKRELSPILAKEKKDWTSWWTVARRQLLAGQSIALEPNKKNVLSSTTFASAEPPEDWVAQVRDAKTPQGLLAVAKSLELAPDQARSEGARSIAKAALIAFSSARSQDRDFLELLCCFSYILPLVEKTEADNILEKIDKTGLKDICVPSDLEDELSTALTRLSRCASFPDFALSVMNHPSPQVQARAFGALNAERHRHVLKRVLLDWVRNPEDRVVPKPSLYLREEFLRYLRLEDTFCLFRNLIERPAIADRPAVREFLERSVGTVFTSGHTDDPLRIAILQSRLISDEAKRDAIKNHPALEGLVDCLTNNFGPELRRPLVWTLNELQGGLPTGVWTRVLDILGASGASDLINAVAKLCSDRLESASEASAFLIVSQICDLFGIVDEHAPESRRLLETALESFGRKISVLGASIAPDAMVRGVRAEMETHQREARQEADKLANLNNALNAEVLSVRREAQRLLELVDTLKSSAAFDRHELQTTSRIEAVRPFLLLLDDLHRQSVSASAPLRSLIDQVENALTRAGLEQIGVAGGTLTFDASLHEFADEPGQVPTLASVRVVRPGYTVFEGTGRRIVRRALVRPAW